MKVAVAPMIALVTKPVSLENAPPLNVPAIAIALEKFVRIINVLKAVGAIPIAQQAKFVAMTNARTIVLQINSALQDRFVKQASVKMAAAQAKIVVRANIVRMADVMRDA